MSCEFKIGAVGWDHPGWSGGFYPDDLPPEWRLTYYANEFPLVLVPRKTWMADGGGGVPSWCEDVADSFRFVLDVTGMPADSGALKKLRTRITELGERLAGVVSWQTLPAAEQVSLCSVLRQGQWLAVSESSLPKDKGVQVAVGETVVCGLLSGGSGHDLPWLRSVLESLKSRGGQLDALLLFVSGEPPEIKVLREAEILWQLL